VSLFNSVYKILAKLFAKRLPKFLPHIVQPNQTGFMARRNTVDNIFLAKENMEWAVHNKHDLVLLLLHFEKAFDKIDQGFMFATFKALGFCEAQVSWVTTL
jgi:hypothetical protein